MQRRALLGGVASALVAGLAGCVSVAAPSGPRTPPRSPVPTEPPPDDLVVADFLPRETEDGDLAVEVVVENPAAERQTGTVVVEASAEGTDETVRREVSLEGGTRTTVVLETTLSYESFTQQGSLRVSIQ